MSHYIIPQILPISRIKTTNTPQQRMYTRAEVCCILASLLKLNYETFEILSEKLNQPIVPIINLAKKRKITRQTAYVRIKACCESIPELKQTFKIQEKNVNKSPATT